MVKKHLGPDEVEILKDKVRPEDVEGDEDDEGEGPDDDDDEDPDDEEDPDDDECDEGRETNEIAKAFQRWGVDPDEYFERA